MATRVVTVIEAAVKSAFCQKLSENRDVLQERDDTNDDDYDLSNLLGTAIERQTTNEIENQHNHQKGDQDADENRCNQSSNS
jgi:hypothetical protein